MSSDLPTYIIEGITMDGDVFRPTDWIERLIDTASLYGADRRASPRPCSGPDRRSRQISFLQAQVCDGHACLIVDLRLRDANPQAFEFLMEFARSNRLRWHALP
jgi:hypothetical protein